MLSLNLWNELTFGQKLQVAFLVVMFSIAGFLAWRSNRPVRDMTITSWVETRKVGADASKPVGPTNPADPKRSVVVTIFACHDGHMEISEFPDDAEAKPAFQFIPSTFIKSYDFYKNPTAHLRSISDPARYAVALAAYNMTHYKMLNLGPNLIARAAMTLEQAKTERTLQHELVSKVEHVRADAKSGFYKADLRDRAMLALMAYRAREGDPTRDSTKANMAWKTLDDAMAYVNSAFDEESRAVDAYTDGVMGLLSREQRGNLAEAGKLAQAGASLRMTEDKAEVNAATGVPNLAHVKHALNKSLTLLDEAIKSNDEKRVVAAVALVLEILDDADASQRFKAALETHIDAWLKELIGQKRQQLVESLASTAMETYAGDELFVSLCQERRKMDPGKAGLVFATTKGGATMRAVATTGTRPAATRVATTATRPAATRVATTGRAPVPAPKAALDADGVPNVMYIANSIPKGLAALTDLITSNDEGRIHKALAAIEDMYASPTLCRKANSMMFERKAEEWVRELLKQKRFDEAEKLAVATILKFPYNAGFIDVLQAERVQGKLAQGKADEALVLAKSLYNVCSIGASTGAADLYCQCKLAASAGAELSATMEAFKQAQVAPGVAGMPSALLTNVKVDGRAYEQGIGAAEAAFAGVDGLVAKGNLLLLADQAKEAQGVFEKALAGAVDKDRAVAVDGVARAMRAQDGGVGRAVGYLAEQLGAH